VKHHYHPHAKAEASAAVAYYAEINAELGERFLAEVEDAISRILERPAAWPKHLAGTRRCLLHRFPYSVIYQIESDTIEIVAVMHLHRKPGYWQSRTT
jgi:plasmid stabilization system protein ParE